MEKEELKVINRIKEGYIHEYEFIVKKYQNQIERYLRKNLFDKDEASDLTQETFLKFYKALNRFDEGRPILPYLFEIAKNELRMYFRTHKKTFSLEYADGLVADSKQDNAPVIESVLGNLSAREKRIISLIKKGYVYEEIGKL